MPNLRMAQWHKRLLAKRGRAVCQASGSGRFQVRSAVPPAIGRSGNHILEIGAGNGFPVVRPARIKPIGQNRYPPGPLVTFHMVSQSAHGLYRAPAPQAANQSAADQLRPSSQGNSLFNEKPILPPRRGGRLPKKTQHGIDQVPNRWGDAPSRRCAAYRYHPVVKRCHLLGAQ